MLFTAKVNPDAFVFVPGDIPQALPQRATCGMNDIFSTDVHSSLSVLHHYGSVYLLLQLYPR